MGRGRWGGATQGRGALRALSRQVDSTHSGDHAGGWGAGAFPREPTCCPACPAGGTGGWCWAQCPRPGHRSIGAFWAQGPLLPTWHHPWCQGQARGGRGPAVMGTLWGGSGLSRVPPRPLLLPSPSRERGPGLQEVCRCSSSKACPQPAPNRMPAAFSEETFDSKVPHTARGPPRVRPAQAVMRCQLSDHLDPPCQLQVPAGTRKWGRAAVLGTEGPTRRAQPLSPGWGGGICGAPRVRPPPRPPTRAQGRAGPSFGSGPVAGGPLHLPLRLPPSSQRSAALALSRQGLG